MIAKRLQDPAPMPRHLLQMLSRIGHNDRRCLWYYNNYGRSSSSSSYEASVGAGDGAGSNGASEFVVSELKAEWDQTYVQTLRGSIRMGFQSVSRVIVWGFPLVRCFEFYVVWKQNTMWNDVTF